MDLTCGCPDMNDRRQNLPGGVFRPIGAPITVRGYAWADVVSERGVGLIW
jgi:hypothetical protein